MMRSAALWVALCLMMLAAVPLNVGGAASTEGRPRFFYFIHISDVHVGFDECPTYNLTLLEVFANQVRAVYADLPARPLAVVCTGDITHDGLPEEFEAYLNLTDFGPVPRLDVPGDRDCLGDGGAAWRKFMGALNFSADIEVGGGYYVRFICLNTTRRHNNGGLSRAQRDWALRLIEEAERDPHCLAIFLAGHHPSSPCTDELDFDYRLAPFNRILMGDPWALVRDLILGHRKVLAYLCGHICYDEYLRRYAEGVATIERAPPPPHYDVYANYVIIRGGKFLISTGPLTWGGEPENGGDAGYVYRLVVWDDGVLSTAVFRVGRWPAALITNIPQGAVLSGKVRVRALAVSDVPLREVALLVDNVTRIPMSPVRISEKGGLYEVTLDVEALDDGEHELRVLALDASGRKYVSAPVYIFARVAGGIRWAVSRQAAICFAVLGDAPCARLYVWSGAESERSPFAAVWIPVRGLGNRVLLEACVDLEVVHFRGEIRMFVGGWSRAPRPEDAESVGLMMNSTIAGLLVVSFDEGRFKCALGQRLLAGKKAGAIRPGHLEPILVDFQPSGFGVLLEGSWINDTYPASECDFDDLACAGVMAYTEASKYTQVFVHRLAIVGRLERVLVPGALGVPTRLEVLKAERIPSTGQARLVVRLMDVDGHPVTKGRLVIEGSEDMEHWAPLAEVPLGGAKETVFKIWVEHRPWLRVRYDPGGDPSYLTRDSCRWAPAVSSPVRAAKVASDVLVLRVLEERLHVRRGEEAYLKVQVIFANGSPATKAEPTLESPRVLAPVKIEHLGNATYLVRLDTRRAPPGKYELTITVLMGRFESPRLRRVLVVEPACLNITPMLPRRITKGAPLLLRVNVSYPWGEPVENATVIVRIPELGVYRVMEREVAGVYSVHLDTDEWPVGVVRLEIRARAEGFEETGIIVKLFVARSLKVYAAPAALIAAIIVLIAVLKLRRAAHKPS